MYPALAVLDALRQALPASSGSEELTAAWIGSAAGMEGDIIRRSGLPFHGLALHGGVRGRGPVAAVLGAFGLIRGCLQAVGLVRSLRPQVIMATGGYVSAPAVLAGWLLRVPTLMYLPDMQPGWAVRALAPLARRIAVTTEQSRGYFAARKVVVSGYPVRSAIIGQESKPAREVFGLDPDVPTLLVMGGSRGSHSINIATAQALPNLLLQYQVIHVTGMQEASAMRAVRERLASELKKRYRPYGFLHDDMATALAASDVIVCRAGASVLGEVPAAGLAAILVPLASGHRDQVQNAAFLADKGAALVVNDSGLTADTLQTAIERVTQPERLAAMRQAATALARPDAAAVIAAELMVLARVSRATGGDRHPEGDGNDTP